MGKGKHNKRADGKFPGTTNTPQSLAGVDVGARRQDRQGGGALVSAKPNVDKQAEGLLDEHSDQAKFGRRKVASNWSRYDEPDANLANEDDIIGVDGAKDFSYLVANAGHVASHFKFQDEKKWEQEINSQPIRGAAGVLDLNINILASELASHSLREKLKLDEVLIGCKYCFDSLEQSERVSPVQNTWSGASPVQPSSRQFQWSFHDLENYRDLIFPLKGTCFADNLQGLAGNGQTSKAEDSGSVRIHADDDSLLKNVKPLPAKFGPAAVTLADALTAYDRPHVVAPEGKLFATDKKTETSSLSGQLITGDLRAFPVSSNQNYHELDRASGMESGTDRRSPTVRTTASVESAVSADFFHSLLLSSIPDDDGDIRVSEPSALRTAISPSDPPATSECLPSGSSIHPDLQGIKVRDCVTPVQKVDQSSAQTDELDDWLDALLK